MNVEHLKLFTRVEVTKNISQAGQELGLSPAVASNYLNKLEQSLGVKLLHRTTRHVSLTEDGQAFLPHAIEVLERIESARAAVGVGSQTPQGTLRITAPASFGRMHIIPALKAFLNNYPDLTIDLKLSDTIVDMVEGGFDIAIRNAQLPDSSLIATRLAKDQRVVCVSPDYIKKHGKPTVPSDLKNHQCVNLGQLDDWYFKTKNGDINKIKTHGTLRVDNGESMRDASVDGLGLCICSVWCAYKELRSGQLIQVLENPPLADEAAIWAVYPSSRLLAPKVRAFIDYFKNFYGETAYWEL